MGKATLTYFAVRGRAEPARLVLEDQGVDYENRFVSMEEWPKLKPEFKFGQLPVYSDDENRIEESFAIYNHLARRFGLLPKSEKDLIRHDQVNSLILTSALELGMLFWDPQFEKKRGEMREQKLPTRLRNLERFHSETSGPYWMGDRIHYADYGVWCYLDTVRMFAEDILRDYPRLSLFKKTMESRPRINAYLRSDRRPKSYTVSMAPFGGGNDDWQPEPLG